MSFIQGVWRMLGAEDQDLEQENTVEFPTAKSEAPEQAHQPNEQLIALPEVQPATMFVLRPEVDDRGKAKFKHKDYAHYLRQKQAVVVDVNELAACSREDAIRLIDYLAGVADAIEGSVWEVTKNIFVFVPKNIKLAGDSLKKVEVG